MYAPVISAPKLNPTQVSLQPSFKCLWLKPHPSTNDLSIIMTLSWWLLSWWLLIQTGNGFHYQKWQPYQVRGLFSQPICAGEVRNGPLNANQGLFKLSPNMAMLFAPFNFTHPPLPVPHFLLMQNVSPKENAWSDITRWKFQAIYRAFIGEVLNRKC